VEMALKGSHKATTTTATWAVSGGHVYLPPLLAYDSAWPFEWRPAASLTSRGVPSRSPFSISFFQTRPSKAGRPSPPKRSQPRGTSGIRSSGSLNNSSNHFPGCLSGLIPPSRMQGSTVQSSLGSQPSFNPSVLTARENAPWWRVWQAQPPPRAAALDPTQV